MNVANCELQVEPVELSGTKTSGYVILLRSTEERTEVKKVGHVFATFPEFSKLTLDDREVWEDLIADYPPYSDFSFPTMMTWWNTLNACRVSQLNGNLILSYWIPGDEKNSGLSVVGTRKIDETICSIFDYLKEKGLPARLVHVPEFVISAMSYPELFTFTEERENNECILSTVKLSELEYMPSPKSRRAKKFISNMAEDNIEVKSINLSEYSNKNLLLDLAKQWRKKGVGLTILACVSRNFLSTP